VASFYASRAPSRASPRTRTRSNSARRSIAPALPTRPCQHVRLPQSEWRRHPAQYPRVGSQHGDYTEAQLVAFRGGARANSAQMTTIAAR